MNPIKFEEYKEKIENALVAKGFSLFNIVTKQGDYFLIDKFINQPIQQAISGAFVVGGPTLPMVVLVHAKTGEVKFIALKVIIPDFPLN